LTIRAARLRRGGVRAKEAAALFAIRQTFFLSRAILFCFAAWRARLLKKSRPDGAPFFAKGKSPARRPERRIARRALRESVFQATSKSNRQTGPMARAAAQPMA
jgi:hypothetical protein